ncbi:ABC transporter ATP-binding protein [Arsenicicoccus sp. oral taxon 190]|uniref:ABC transporter ATP-binding protein n=1 Tax=Arsenicicoccus sp. oral taxon 190 TaxID=1658671 RepID=UPI00067A164E|nr:ABC transporter ATP-binding protein [Arsenicicoccus sp. oral taxon 190]AKT51478.1 multidrug ABC transporter ATPase [Arsenicicoccus sp. oral taxon 190]
MLSAILRRHLVRHRGPIALVLLFQTLQVLANLYLPTLNADVIDEGVAKGDTGYVLRVGAIMLLVTLAQIVANVVAIYYGARTAMRFGRDLRAEIFETVERFAAEELGRFGAPTLITRTTNDVQQIQMLVFLTLVMVASTPITAVGSVILALQHDVALSGLLLVVVPVLVACLAFIIWRLHPLFRRMQGQVDTVNQILREQISGVRVIRAFVKDHAEQERFGVANDQLRDVSLAAGRLMTSMFPLIMLIMNLSTVAIVWFGGLRIASGDMQVGDLVAMMTYLMNILMSVLMASMMFMILPRAQVSAERITEVLDTEPTIAAPLEPVRGGHHRGVVGLSDVSFTFPGADDPVLHGITLEATPGRTTAIIGSTGAGKTTLLNLVPRLIDATAGRVTLDGVDVRDLDPEELWRCFGLVPQRPYLFSGTVASNLRLGRADATDDELWQALEIAQARDFVEAMPEGLDAPITQGGTNVSGGQRQRLAIARAVVRRPLVYLFDDSFSALDYATDAALRAALRPITREATVLVVAQRVNTIRDADEIVVLDEGAVVGRGRHHELMADCPTYREIVLSQLSAEEAA